MMDVPEYTVRYSKKAQYLQLKLTLKGLEVVIPHRLKIKEKTIKDFVLSKKHWIHSHYKSISKESVDIALPVNIHFLAFHKQWDVRYIDMQQEKRLRILPSFNHVLHVSGNFLNKAAFFKLLRKWVKKSAFPLLSQELNKLSLETGLAFNKVTIRNNQTRLGSCSIKKDISLCSKLLFLPTRLMHHVLIHELCHTMYMNHGKAFWNLLIHYDKNTKDHRSELKSLRQYVPQWMYEK